MVQKVEFRTTRNRFQTELLKIVRDVGKCKNLIVPSDKIANFYEVPVGEYRKLLNDNITKDQEKCNGRTLNDINLEAKNLTSNLKITTKLKNSLKKRIHNGKRS